MFYSSALFLVFATSSLFAQAAAECNRFSTNGSTASTYDFHRFYDFRQLHDDINGDAASASSYGEGHTVTESASGQSKIIEAAPWVSGWNARDWYRPSSREDTVDMYYKPSRVSISKNSDASQEHSTYLTLHTTRLSDGSQVAAELDFAEYNVTYASIRMSARINGASGAVAAFFTYHDDTNESDIEIPTGGKADEVHYSNQPTADPDTEDPIDGATFNVSMEAHKPTSDWNNYRLDWVPGKSAWYMNGAQSADTEVNVPDTESMIILSLWSNGGTFSGRMGTGQEAWFDIQWVELLFNTSAIASTEPDGTVCSVESSPGSPVPSASRSLQDLVAGRIWWAIGMASTVSFLVSV
ncbi:concanavalin A-like lectin/glucanase domain-containing protein [Alternaria rosae]|uniref:concanavalin A-like lectin/glucanase domain-containing protein n=1 Tax=Alternaria rosae TaxID=1187941 RepID=UPI001E8D8F7A|nr:concanavalin A-like lectin/glucanase domain-containing protein [Alternaria rosae]KAH6865314.1 concanavalin A-like lectin/glucanase domain-containing protein [Alternaria rosae]